MHPEKVDWAWRPELSEMVVRLVRSDERRRYQQLMRAHHYLGYLPKIGETLWYVATWREQWLALLSFSGSALKCAVRDRWIGWTLRQHYGSPWRPCRATPRPCRTRTSGNRERRPSCTPARARRSRRR